ncbi:MAG TPA: hypothetical protein VFC30_03570 [Solirubrobacteraceae bacterium]|nr:hypothetical protein [Solirubrobacteraceae bacterium]
MSHISTFVSRHFEELHALLNASGYLLDFSGREHPRYADRQLLRRYRPLYCGTARARDR